MLNNGFWLVGWRFFAISPLLVVNVGKLPLENPLKPADMYFSNFVCMAFWLNISDLSHTNLKVSILTLVPDTHPQ